MVFFFVCFFFLFVQDGVEHHSSKGVVNGTLFSEWFYKSKIDFPQNQDSAVRNDRYLVLRDLHTLILRKTLKGRSDKLRD